MGTAVGVAGAAGVVIDPGAACKGAVGCTAASGFAGGAVVVTVAAAGAGLAAVELGTVGVGAAAGAGAGVATAVGWGVVGTSAML